MVWNARHPLRPLHPLTGGRKIGVRRRRAMIGLTAALVLAVTGAWMWRAGRWGVQWNERPLVVAYRHDGGSPVAGSAWAKRAQALCDCTIEWRDVTPGTLEWERVRGVASYDDPELGLAAPDVLINMIDRSGYGETSASRGESGRTLVDLSAHRDVMPNVDAYLHEEPEAYTAARESDGSVRVLPGDAGDDFDGAQVHLFINRAWTERLGLEAPTTWDELERVLEAFRDGDPNGNGEHDEIPLLLAPPVDAAGDDRSKPVIDDWRLFLNGTGVTTQLAEMPGNDGFSVKDGIITSYAMSDELHAVADYLARLAANGLTARESFHGAYAQLQYNRRAQELNEQGGFDPASPIAETSGDGGAVRGSRAWYDGLLSASTAVVGAAFVRDASAFGANADMYESIPMPARDDVTPVTWDFSRRARFNLNGVAVNAATTRLDAALRLVDALYDETVSIGQYYGDDGVTVTIGEPTCIIIDGGGVTGGTDGGTSDDRLMDNGTTEGYRGGYGHGFAGWIRSGTLISGDCERDLFIEAERPYRAIHATAANDMFPLTICADGADASPRALWNAAMESYVAELMMTAYPGSDLSQAWTNYIDGMSVDSKSCSVASLLEEEVSKWQTIYSRYESE